MSGERERDNSKCCGQSLWGTSGNNMPPVRQSPSLMYNKRKKYVSCLCMFHQTTPCPTNPPPSPSPILSVSKVQSCNNETKQLFVSQETDKVDWNCMGLQKSATTFSIGLSKSSICPCVHDDCMFLSLCLFLYLFLCFHIYFTIQLALY